MSKDMNVIIHLLDERPDLAAKAHRLMRAKRLTDAELSAEVFFAVFHEAECEVRARQLGEGHPAFNHWLKANHEYARQSEIVERFATSPSYDEARS